MNTFKKFIAKVLTLALVSTFLVGIVPAQQAFAATTVPGDQEICPLVGETYNAIATTDAAGPYLWTSTGSAGTFATPTNTSTLYTSTVADVAAGVITLTFATTTPLETASFDLTFVDNTDPVVACFDTTVSITPTQDVTVGPGDVGTSSDNCGSTIDSVSPNYFTCAGLGDHTVTFMATDASGNNATCDSTVTIDDAGGECPPDWTEEIYVLADGPNPGDLAVVTQYDPFSDTQWVIGREHSTGSPDYLPTDEYASLTYNVDDSVVYVGNVDGSAVWYISPGPVVNILPAGALTNPTGDSLAALEYDFVGGEIYGFFAMPDGSFDVYKDAVVGNVFAGASSFVTSVPDVVPFDTLVSGDFPNQFAMGFRALRLNADIIDIASGIVDNVTSATPGNLSGKGNSDFVGTFRETALELDGWVHVQEIATYPWSPLVQIAEGDIFEEVDSGDESYPESPLPAGNDYLPIDDITAEVTSGIHDFNGFFDVIVPSGTYAALDYTCNTPANLVEITDVTALVDFAAELSPAAFAALTGDETDIFQIVKEDNGVLMDNETEHIFFCDAIPGSPVTVELSGLTDGSVWDGNFPGWLGLANGNETELMSWVNNVSGITASAGDDVIVAVLNSCTLAYTVDTPAPAKIPTTAKAWNALNNIALPDGQNGRTFWEGIDAINLKGPCNVNIRVEEAELGVAPATDGYGWHTFGHKWYVSQWGAGFVGQEQRVFRTWADVASDLVPAPGAPTVTFDIQTVDGTGGGGVGIETNFDNTGAYQEILLRQGIYGQVDLRAPNFTFNSDLGVTTSGDYNFAPTITVDSTV